MRLPRPAVPEGLAPQARATMQTLAVSLRQLRCLCWLHC